MKSAFFLAVLLSIAQTAIGQTQDEKNKVISDVIKLIDDPNPNVRVRTVNTLGILGYWNDESVAALTKSLADVNGMVRSEAVKVLGKIGPDAAAAVPTLLKLYKAEVHQSTRTEIIATLGFISPASKDAMNWLVTIARSPGAGVDDTIRLEAIKVLGSLGEKAKPAVPTLIAMLNYSASSTLDWSNVYVACALALTKIGDARAVESFSKHRQGRGVRGTQPDRIIQAADTAAREFEKASR